MSTEVIDLTSHVEVTNVLSSHVSNPFTLQSLITNTLKINPITTLTLAQIDTGTDPGEITFNWTASDSDGTVAKIEFFRKESLEPSFTILPGTILTPGASGTFQDTAIAQGTYEYKSRVTDDEGNIGESAIVSGLVIASGNAIPFLIQFENTPDGNVADGIDLNGYAGIARPEIESSGVANQTSRILTLTTPTNPDSSFLSVYNDLLTGPTTGQFTITFDIQIDSISGQFDFMLISAAAPITSNAGSVEPTSATIWLTAFSSGTIAFRFRNLGGGLVDHALHGGSVETGKIIRCALQKDATNYTWDYDIAGVTANGRKTSSRLISTIQQPVSKEFFMGGDLFTIASNGVSKYNGVGSNGVGVTSP